MLVDIVVPGAHAMESADAVTNADLVVLAVPLHKYKSVPQDLLEGKLVIDTMNYWPPIDGALDDFEQRMTSSEVISAHFASARIVKTLNHVGYHDLEIDARPAGATDRRALGVAGDSPTDVSAVADAIERFGFDAVAIGPLRNGEALQPGQPIFGGHHTRTQLIDALPSSQSAPHIAAFENA